LLLQRRYKILTDRVLVDAGHLKVYQGVDAESGRDVAVRIFPDTEGEFFACFRRGVEVLRAIQRNGQRARRRCDVSDCLMEDLERVEDPIDKRNAWFIACQMDMRDYFMELLSFSTDSSGHAGVDTESKLLFMVFEPCEVSLKDELDACTGDGRVLTVDMLRPLHWALVSIVCSLHSEGFVHADLSPKGVVRLPAPEKQEFHEGVPVWRPTWKLLDMDGAMPVAEPVRCLDLAFSPEYASPELAAAYLKAKREPVRVQLRRSMDIWSAGMCAVDSVFHRPLLSALLGESRLEFQQARLRHGEATSRVTRGESQTFRDKPGTLTHAQTGMLPLGRGASLDVPMLADTAGPCAPLPGGDGSQATDLAAATCTDLQAFASTSSTGFGTISPRLRSSGSAPLPSSGAATQRPVVRGDTRVLDWLGGAAAPAAAREPLLSGELLRELAAVDEDMCELLEGMLVKDAGCRPGIGHCLVHRWFAPIHRQILGSAFGQKFLQNVDELCSRAMEEDEAAQLLVTSATPVFAEVPATPAEAAAPAPAPDEGPENRRVMARTCAVM